MENGARGAKPWFPKEALQGTDIPYQGPDSPAGGARDRLGAGEVVINSTDRDGVMNGYDMDLIAQVREAIGLPITVLGGAGSLNDIAKLIHTFGIIGAAAGSLFVFKGIYRAVLINYPSCAEKDALIQVTLPA